MSLIKLHGQCLLSAKFSIKQCARHSSANSGFKSRWIKTSENSPAGIIHSSLDFDPTFNQTIPEFLKLNLHKWENAPAFECAITGRKYTHGEVHRKGESFGVALKHHGVHRRDAVCILLPNIPEYPIVALGVWNAGALLTTINPAYTVEEIAKQVRDSESSVIVTIPQLIPTVEKVKEKCPTLKSIIVVGDAQGNHSFFDMLNTDTSSGKLLKGTDINTMKETAVLPYSSGTTGPPKGVELTHSTFTTNLLQITYPGFRLTEFFDKGNGQDRFIALLPFFHMYGLQIIMANTLHQGAHTLCFPKFEPESFIKGFKHHKPTVLHLVTPLMNFMCHNKELTPEDLKHARGTIAGGAPIGKNIIDRFTSIFDHYTLFQEGFGMTEISSVSHIIPPEVKNSKAGSSGVVIPGTSTKVVVLDSGNIAKPMEAGEICVRGPQIMKGYYKNKEATNEMIDSEGFLKTGDIGYHDEEGFLWIVDRLKELIKVKGLQVAPAELENILRKHPEVADVAVIGVPHDKLGEAPRAYIVPKSKNLQESSITKFLEPEVSEHKKLAGGVEFIEAIPKAASGKILRRVLRGSYSKK